ncbi:uncharacterized protein LOC133800865 isoform X1 [Humulus lupulus]|uniref:uncharacterized protein LOC133800865 isoform X1 n=1 Tax=Humulus lupulus TaxID=3486 RepID=UPI002B410F38|nr:uncharacterized protein LOC133800865 isoform X1 [Humulus lupulus]
MAFSEAFHERLERMEFDRNKRLSLLQAEKELESSKSLVLASKLAEIRATEQRCFVLDQKIAVQNFKILALKSEIETIDSNYEIYSKQLRDLMNEVADLEELEKQKDQFYESKISEMKEFKQKAEGFGLELRTRVQNLKICLSQIQKFQLQKSFVKFQGNNGYSNNSEIAAAEMMKSQLLAAKHELDKNLASNLRMKTHLQMELQSISSIDNTKN